MHYKENQKNATVNVASTSPSTTTLFQPKFENVGRRNRIKDVIKQLNEKINKLYNWHMIELDLVSKQQIQLNEMRSELDSTKESVNSWVTSSVSSPKKSLFLKQTLQKCYSTLKEQDTPQTELDALASCIQHVETGLQQTAKISEAEVLKDTTKTIKSEPTNKGQSIGNEDSLRMSKSEKSLDILNETKACDNGLQSFSVENMKSDKPIKRSPEHGKTKDQPQSLEFSESEKQVLNEWLSQLSEDLNTTHLSLKRVLQLTDPKNEKSEMDSKVFEFHHIATTCELFSKFEIPKHITSLLASRNSSNEVQIKIKEHVSALNTIKSSVHDLTSAILSKDTDIQLIRELVKSNSTALKNEYTLTLSNL